jgi:Family of unknown function (DUF6527)
MKQAALVHEFVEFMPEELKEGVLYVSMQHAIAIHRCCCGCRNEVVTPLSPTDWQLTFDGDSITLCPSIGNWGFDCQSHYWIKRNAVRWSSHWTSEEIKTGRVADIRAKKEYLGLSASPDLLDGSPESKLTSSTPTSDGFWRALWRRKWR